MNAKTSVIAISVGIAASVVGASAALLYMLLKKDEKLKEITEGDVKTSPHTSLQFHVPRHTVGSVIGRNGANIKEIQVKTNTKINFDNAKDEDDENQDRVVTIRGLPQDVMEAKALIEKLIAEQPDILTEEIFIPVRACGRVIGRNGDTIRQMCRSSKAKILVDRSGDERDLDNLKRVTIRGSRAQIDLAISLIDEKIAEEEVFRQKVESSSSRPVRYKGKLLSIESSPVPSNNASGDYHMEEAFPAASDNYTETYVSALETPHQFWVQLVTPKCVQLDKMVEEMTEFYSNPANETCTRLSKVKAGDVVAAPFRHDASWYRAQVTVVKEDDYTENNAELTIFYVDFGDIGKVKQDKVRTLKLDYLSLPFQAIECCLSGVRPVGDVWTEGAIDLFEELCYAAQWKVIMAKVVGYVEKEYPLGSKKVAVVELVDTNEINDLNIAEELVNKKLAIWENTKE